MSQLCPEPVPQTRTDHKYIQNMRLKVTILTIVLFCLSVMASAQEYVIDNIFGKDSVALVTGIKDKTVSAGYGASKNKKVQEVKIDTVFVSNGESVLLKDVKKDSLRVLHLLVEEVAVEYGKNTYYTFAGNLKFSEDNPEGTVDTLTARLKNHKGIDIHGKDRWLFARWLILALLILGFAGVLLTIFKGRIGRIILVIALVLIDAYIFMIGLDTATWFINSNLTSEVFSLVCIGLFLVYFAITVRIIVSLFKTKEAGSILFAILLIILGIPMLGLVYLVVFSVAMALLFKYWWIGAAIVGIIILLCLPEVKEGELEKMRRESAAAEKKREAEKAAEQFERSYNKKVWDDK